MFSYASTQDKMDISLLELPGNGATRQIVMIDEPDEPDEYKTVSFPGLTTNQARIEKPTTPTRPKPPL